MIKSILACLDVFGETPVSVHSPIWNKTQSSRDCRSKINTYLIVIIIAVDIELISDGRRGYSIIYRKRLLLPTPCSQRFYSPVWILFGLGMPKARCRVSSSDVRCVWGFRWFCWVISKCLVHRSWYLAVLRQMLSNLQSGCHLLFRRMTRPPSPRNLIWPALIDDGEVTLREYCSSASIILLVLIVSFWSSMSDRARRFLFVWEDEW